MVSRSLFLTLLLAAALAMPYVVSTGFGSRKKAGEFASVPASLGGARSASLGGAAPRVAYGGPGLAPVGDPRSRDLASPAAVDGPISPSASSMKLEDVINFNVTPAWVMSQWPRVSASLTEFDYQGYRVSLVSGTRPDDLTGSLTYYFDSSQHLMRITFQGTTGDPRRLVQLVTSRFGMGQIASGDPGVVAYAVKWNNQPRSELRIRTASVVRASESRASYQVDLALRRF